MCLPTATAVALVREALWDDDWKTFCWISRKQVSAKEREAGGGTEGPATWVVGGCCGVVVVKVCAVRVGWVGGVVRVRSWRRGMRGCR